MGRPPNPLVVEYFRRGKKLKDKSNRYEHTCKKCGSLDKSGRPEKLIDHLVKCSQLEYDQRQDILARHLNQRSGLRNGDEGISSRSVTPPAYAGLEGLAEAARRVSAHEPSVVSPILPNTAIPIDPSIGYATANFYAPSTSLQQTPSTQNLYHPKGPDMLSIQETASPDVYSHYAIVDDLEDGGTEQNISTITSSAIASNAIQTLTQQPLTLPVPGQPAPSTPISLPFQPSVSAPPPVANHEPISNQPSPAVSSDHSASAPTITNSTRFATSAPPYTFSQLPSPSSTPSAMPSGHNIANAEFSQASVSSIADTGSSPKSNRPKRTSKLQPQQREKTARIRRQGACIRCRLLKKPCSGDDPCQQCQSIHNPRTWRHPCQRVKLHEEVTIYSAGLRRALSQQKMQDLAKSHVVSEDASDTFIRVSFSSLESRLSFKAMRYQPKIEGHTSDYGEVFVIDSITTYLNQMDSKLKRYLKEEYTPLLEAEQSPIIRSTLRLCKRIALDQNDEILSSVLELWAATLLLTDDSDRMEISLKVHNGSEAEILEVNKQSDGRSYDTIRGQLLSAIEVNVGAQLQKLLVRLEARLQKPKSCLFETFLACLLLLNCAERMCWLVRHWQIPELALQPWPLQKEQPIDLVQQGETMASVLHMIMDMRNVLPKPHATNEGRLVAPPKASEDVRTWFNEVDLSVQELKTMEARPFVADDLRSMDGRFWARTLSVDDRMEGRC